MSGDLLATDGVVVRVATGVAGVAVERSKANGSDEVGICVDDAARAETGTVEGS